MRAALSIPGPNGGRIEIRDGAGFGYELDRDYIGSITIREETIAPGAA